MYPNYVSNGYANTFYPQLSSEYNQPQQAALSNNTQVRYVNSEQEARDAQIPMNGLPYFFINRNTGEIYSKRLDYNTGGFPFTIYREVSTPVVQKQEYVTVSQFEDRMRQLESMINSQKPTGGVTQNE